MKIKNCIIYDKQDQGRHDLILENGKIESIKKQSGRKTEMVIDAQGRIIAPGFIDIHIHGAGGADVGDGNEEALRTMCQTLARYGVTSFLATTMMDPDADNQHLKKLRRSLPKNYHGANILGLHLEGPFISRENRRGIPARAVYDYSENSLDEILDLTGKKLKMMTIAPEIKNGLEMVDALKKNNIIPALGHTRATYQETKAGFRAGIQHVTHIFNAMPSLHHRNPGPLLAIFESDKVSAQIISDGVHLAPEIVNYLYNTLGEERCICITDGIQAIGLPDGKYEYYGREYIKKEGSASYLDGTLIGTTLDTGTIAFKFKEFTGCSLATAVNTVTKNPARLLGISARKGSLEQGKDADLVILNDDNSVHATFVAGELVYIEE